MCEIYCVLSVCTLLRGTWESGVHVLACLPPGNPPPPFVRVIRHAGGRLWNDVCPSYSWEPHTGTSTCAHPTASLLPFVPTYTDDRRCPLRESQRLLVGLEARPEKLRNRCPVYESRFPPTPAPMVDRRPTAPVPAVSGPMPPWSSSLSSSSASRYSQRICMQYNSLPADYLPGQTRSKTPIWKTSTSANSCASSGRPSPIPPAINGRLTSVGCAYTTHAVSRSRLVSRNFFISHVVL